MSTRANIAVTDNCGETLWYYRHSDGYPNGTLPTLKRFLAGVATEKIRDNVGQSAGWLILLGAEEYGVGFGGALTQHSWKCGAYEPTVGIHGDIEYLYVINVSSKRLSVYETWNTSDTDLDAIVSGHKPNVVIMGDDVVNEKCNM